jgi:hypothetical protein
MVLLAPFRVSVAVTNPVLKADSFVIDVRSWPSEKRGVLGQFWDIGKVPIRNFDWLPFTPLWPPSPVLHLPFFTVGVGMGFTQFHPRCPPLGRRVSVSPGLPQNSDMVA